MHLRKKKIENNCLNINIQRKKVRKSNNTKNLFIIIIQTMYEKFKARRITKYTQSTHSPHYTNTRFTSYKKITNHKIKKVQFCVRAQF